MHANQNINRKRRTEEREGGRKSRRGRDQARRQQEIESAKNKAKINYLTMKTKQKIRRTRQKEQ